MKDLINILDLSISDIDELIKVATDIKAHPTKYADACRGKTLATLFFEPSTRTRLSFEAAMYGLGGNVLGFADGGRMSSASKGETVSDTARIVSIYADIIAMRHHIEGAPLAAGLAARVPVINAGDGGHFHPTQTLADLLTISSECGRLNNLTIGICGDLKYGRTVHSLIAAMSRYQNIRFILISPASLALPEYVIREMNAAGIEYVQTTSLTKYMSELDVLYMTRVQKERFDADELAQDDGEGYILNNETLSTAKPEMRILHPLPRVDEIAVEVDRDPRAKYFEQAEYGKFIRMALILRLLYSSGKDESIKTLKAETKCPNDRCIVAVEPEIERHAYLAPDGKLRCLYCDAALE
ncbi:MAG: aspartate carbamoyltransferase [Clostridia bacterium]|nr:aspartate carbamoyltransferase [Clostridia bacterium]